MAFIRGNRRRETPWKKKRHEGLIEQCDRDRNFNENSLRQVSASEKKNTVINRI